MPEPSTRPVISIVIGVLNGAKLIEKAMDSFARQTLVAKELVVVDGLSKDGTVDILKRRSHELGYWTSRKDTGLYDAWNHALDHCRGDYVGFLGCDDEFVDDGVLERLARPASQDPPPDLICSINAVVDAQGRFVKTLGTPWNWTTMQRGINIAHAALLHRRDLFARHGKFSTAYRIGGDYEFLLRLGPDARAAFVEQLSVRVGGDGMSHRLWRTTYREHFDLQAKSPYVGPRVAARNLVSNIARYAYRRLRGRR